MPINYDINDEIDNLDERLDDLENNSGGGATITSKGWWGLEGSAWVKFN